MKFSSTNIGFAAATLVVLGGLYWFFFPGKSTPIETLPLSETSSVPPLESRFLELTNQLTPIDFDTRVFANPRFAALVDITTAIVSEASGRTDPFAPLSSNSAGSSATPSATPGAL